MNRRHHFIGRVVLAAVIALSLPGALLAADPRVLAPQSSRHWAGEFWKWAYSMPADAHPLTDTADCSEGQPHSVFFLGGTFAATPTEDGGFLGQATRTCTVPAGSRIFFPILNAECSTIEGNGETEEDLRACAAWLMDHAHDAWAEIDGVAVTDVMSYRTQSPLFIFGPLPENSLLSGYGDVAGQSSPAVADGIHIGLAPLPAGEHVIRFGGALTFTAEADGFDYDFVLDITYYLTVERTGRR